jgi:hypothetical protein
MNPTNDYPEQLALPHIDQPKYFRLCCCCGAIWEPDKVYNFAGLCPSCNGKATTVREAMDLDEWIRTQGKAGDRYRHITGDDQGRPTK